MKAILKIVTLIFLLLSASLTVGFGVLKASDALIVPLQYPTISVAISHASPGDTIQVQSGTYTEDIIIDKSLTLVGQSGAVIVGVGGSTPHAAVTLAAPSITISGFTITSTKYANTTRYTYGVWVNGDNCTITGNTIQDTYLGIFNSVQSYTTIKSNTITGSIKDAIRFAGGSQNTFTENNITKNTISAIALNGYSNTVTNNILQNNTRGIGLGATNSVVYGNTIQFNNESAIWLGGSQNVISANDFSNNKYGIYISNQSSAPTANKLYSNNFLDNKYNAFNSSPELVETWDNGATSGGNYWSDSATKTPYVIDSNNKDNHPLSEPFDLQKLGNAPSAISAAIAKPNSIVASWSFDSIENNLVTPDSTGNNPAVLGSETPAYNYTPAVVPGKFGSALNFTGNVYAAVHPSPSLRTPNEVTIDAWVYMQEIKDVAYDNIYIEALRTPAPLPIRTLGLAVNGEIPQNTSSPPIGALRGYVLTAAGLNEIDTQQPLPFNTWVHVVFVRSETKGMHLYVDGKEQAVMVFSGTQNPAGPILDSTDIYIGHDATLAIDELKITDTAESLGQPGQPIWMQWWVWLVAVAALLGAGFFIYRKRLVVKNWK